MNITLQNGLMMTVLTSRKKGLREAYASLTPYNKQGIVRISFYDNGYAQEVCTCISEGFISIRNYCQGSLISEVFMDTLYQKTFCYRYGVDGKVSETRVEGTHIPKNIPANSRAVLMHTPICLYEALRTMPQYIFTNRPYPMAYSKAHSRVSAA